MTNQDILRIAMTQSAADLCAAPDDFEKSENKNFPAEFVHTLRVKPFPSYTICAKKENLNKVLFLILQVLLFNHYRKYHRHNRNNTQDKDIL